MKKINLLLGSLLLLLSSTYSQYKLKHFKEGYIVKGQDTVMCKVYTGEDPYNKVVFKYTDSKFEEAIEYYPGSIVKAYGMKKDSVLKEFTVISKKKSSWLSKRNEEVYGEVLVKGPLLLIEHRETKVTPGMVNSGGGFGMGSTRNIIRHFLIHSEKDSAIVLTAPALFGIGIDEEELIKIFSEFPELAARVKKKTKLADLVTYIKEYNLWYVARKNE